MVRAGHRLAAIGTGVALVTTLGGPALAAPAAAPGRGRPAAPRAFLIHLIDGGDPIVVQKYTEDGGQIRFEKYGGWVAIPSYEVLRIVPDDSDDTADTLAAGAGGGVRGAALRRHAERGDPPGHQRRRDRRGGSRQHPRGLAHVPSGGSRRVCCACPRPPPCRRPGSPSGGPTTETVARALRLRGPGPPPQAPPPTLSNRPHLLQLANGVGDPGGRLLARGGGDPLPASRRGRRLRARARSPGSSRRRSSRFEAASRPDSSAGSGPIAWRSGCARAPSASG